MSTVPSYFVIGNIPVNLSVIITEPSGPHSYLGSIETYHVKNSGGNLCKISTKANNEPNVTS